MKTIRFNPLDLAAEAESDETILDVARRIGAPVGTSCGGLGICVRCRVTVLEGGERLTEPTMIERDQSRLNKFEENERLACQAVITGDCTVTTSYW